MKIIIDFMVVNGIGRVNNNRQNMKFLNVFLNNNHQSFDKE